jgi:hypothetical protein
LVFVIVDWTLLQAPPTPSITITNNSGAYTAAAFDLPVRFVKECMPHSIS